MSKDWRNSRTYFLFGYGSKSELPYLVDPRLEWVKTKCSDSYVLETKTYTVVNFVHWNELYLRFIDEKLEMEYLLRFGSEASSPRYQGV